MVPDCLWLQLHRYKLGERPYAEGFREPEDCRYLFPHCYRPWCVFDDEMLQTDRRVQLEPGGLYCDDPALT